MGRWSELDDSTCTNICITVYDACMPIMEEGYAIILFAADSMKVAALFLCLVKWHFHNVAKLS